MVTMVTSTNDGKNTSDSNRKMATPEGKARGRSQEPRDQKEGEKRKNSPRSKQMSSPVKARKMRRGTTKEGTPVTSPARKGNKYRYNTKQDTRSSSGSSEKGAKIGSKLSQSKLQAHQNLSNRLVTMASDAVGMLMGTTQQEIKIKQEMIESSDRYNQTLEQAQGEMAKTSGKTKDKAIEIDDISMDEGSPKAKPNLQINTTIEIADNKEEAKFDENSGKTLTITPDRRIQNPYRHHTKPLEIIRVQEEKDDKQEEKQDGNTPTSSNQHTPKAAGSSPSWSAVASNQTKIRTHEKVKHQYNMYAEMGFVVERECKDLPPTVAQTIVREALVNIFRRGKEVDHKFAINPYFEGTNLPTIKKIEDIPLAPSEVKAYLPHVYQRKTKVRQGRNTGYLANFTFTIEPDEFVHLWELSKREYKKVPYVQIKMTPMQDSETYNTIGFLVNSSEKQCTAQLQAVMAKELGMKIGIAYRQAAVDKGAIDKCWKEAKERAGSDSKALFRRAPMVMQMYTDTKENALAAAAKLYPMYGKQTEGHYPRFPDGTRMKFVPASHFLDMKSRQTAKELLRQHIWVRTNTVKAPIQIRDPYQRFKAHNNRSMMELLLDLQCKERDNEPYFRLVSKKWTKDYEDERYEVLVHTNMYSEAASILRRLPEVLTKEYGPEVAAALGNPTPTDDEDFISMTSASLITLNTEDRYMNGNGRFIFEGLETLTREEAPMEKKGDRSINIRSTTSGLTDHQTVESSDKYADGLTENTANQAIDHNIGRGTPPRPRQAQTDGFTRVGTTADEERLRRRMTEILPPDPGGKKGRPYP